MPRFTFIIFVMFLSLSQIQASPYPPEAHHQRVYMHKEGPLKAFLVSNVCLSKWILVYDRNGVLATHNTQNIDAHIFSSCWVDDQLMHRQHIRVRLGKDWQGSGHFFSTELSPGQLQNIRCRTTLDRDTEVAFHSQENDSWDSDYSNNYRVPIVKIWRQDYFDTKARGCTHISPEAYDYIRSQL